MFPPLQVDSRATVWCDKARKTITEHDNTCMERKGNSKVKDDAKHILTTHEWK